MAKNGPRSPRFPIGIIWVTAAIAACLAMIGAASPPSPPQPPTTGPGSNDYAHGGITVHQYGEGDAQFWIFEPAKPAPDSAPVIVFNHGWGGMFPNTYGEWIEHLVRRGNIVIYPRYQATLRTPPKDFTPNAVTALKAALAELKNSSHVKPRLDQFAIVGHSMGGAIAANMAALAATQGLPVPKAICCIEPDNKIRETEVAVMPLEDLSKIPPATLAQVIVGDRDMTAGTETAKEIFADLAQIPPANKDYITLVTDGYGSPRLIASHMAPVAPKELVPEKADEATLQARQRMRQEGLIGVSALDYYGIWKLFDGLTDDAFFGRNGEYALGDTPQQRYMGLWSDGTPVKELRVTQHP